MLPELSHLQIVVHLTEDLLSRASMTVVNGRPTLTINISTAREHWLEGMLRHEIGMSMTSVLQAKGSTCMRSYLFCSDGPRHCTYTEGENVPVQRTYAVDALKGRRNLFITAPHSRRKIIHLRIPRNHVN